MPKEGPVYDLKGMRTNYVASPQQQSWQPCAQKGFWKEIEKTTGAHAPRPLTIGGVTVDVNIATSWQVHFEKLFNSQANETANYENECNDIHDDVGDLVATADEVKDAIVKLKKVMASGPNAISVEHIIHASHRPVIILSIYFNVFLMHDVLPNSLMRVNIAPVVTNKAGLVHIISNYRLIELFSHDVTAHSWFQQLNALMLNDIAQPF